jgi:hypothetical protein
LIGFSRTTAIKDLKLIEEMKLVKSKKMGRYVRYYGTELFKKAIISK